SGQRRGGHVGGAGASCDQPEFLTLGQSSCHLQVNPTQPSPTHRGHTSPDSARWPSPRNWLLYVSGPVKYPMPRQRGHVSAGISTLVPSARSTFPMKLATL